MSFIPCPTCGGFNGLICMTLFRCGCPTETEQRRSQFLSVLVERTKLKTKVDFVLRGLLNLGKPR